MARKQKQEEGGGGSPAWMSTFSDLMNLLLCFFVLLFSMSTIDAEKYEEVVASLNASFGIFDGGATSITEGNLISSGISQLSEFNDYYNNLGITQNENEQDVIESLDKYEEYIKNENIKDSEAIGEDISDKLEGEGIGDDINITVEELYVQLTLNGKLLFDSGEAALKETSTDTINKLGDILTYYDDYMIKIIGYTDTVPMSANKKYADNWELSNARAYTILKFLCDQKGMSEETMECSGRGENDPVATNETAEGRELNRRVEIRVYNKYSSGLEEYK